jgi:hypothetical protein
MGRSVARPELWSGDRRGLVGGVLAAVGVAGVAGAAFPEKSEAHGHHKRRRKRCRHRCKNNRKTCDRACNVLDPGDSRDLCKQGCRVAMSQCRADC